jgi:hypothetical protein
VNEQTHPGLHVDEETVASFAVHLDAFARTLSEREYNMLAGLLLSALDPLQRMRLRDAEELLSTEEAAIVAALEAERRSE